MPPGGVAFNKLLFPSLPLGCLFAPPSLVDLLAGMRAAANACPALLDPATLTLFMNEGHFARHIRRLRSLDQQRLLVLERALRRRLAGVMRLEKGARGMHVGAWLESGWDDQEWSAKPAAAGLLAQPLSRYRLQHNQPPGLLLGLAGFPPQVMAGAIEKLAQAADR
jgi:GntR family transcriptional regulator/MocR family aminotransferase